ncbi:hypothetical protein E2C01_099397 [Portunus trituberculatus]|uniref:Uncharacterized protein n=1 Tax=Portunus trituberculatus TaxID=210409 RepID=A0A5B7KA91_PORTR|nr:hypothetical protein [Portunus trituberculatus]
MLSRALPRRRAYTVAAAGHSGRNTGAAEMGATDPNNVVFFARGFSGQGRYCFGEMFMMSSSPEAVEKRAGRGSGESRRG